MGESNKERNKVRGIKITRSFASDALIFDLQNIKNGDFFVYKCDKNDYSDKPYVGNLTKGLQSVEENNREREKVRARRFTQHCVSDALIFDLQNSKNVEFLCINAIKHDF